MTTDDITEALKDKSLWESGFMTRDGRPVRIVADVSDLEYGIVGVIEGHKTVGTWSNRGHWAIGGVSPSDLVRKPVKRKGWIGFIDNGDPRYVADVIATDVYSTKATLIAQMEARRWDSCRATMLEIEYEVPR